MGVTVTVDEFGLDAEVSGFGKKVHSARCLHATVTVVSRNCPNTGRR
jgi:hypothetical protein